MILIQQAFVDEGAVQCGFCIPGMIMSSKALLDKKEKPTEDEIKESIEGNLCRCTGYVKIIDAIKYSCRWEVTMGGLNVVGKRSRRRMRP